MNQLLRKSLTHGVWLALGICAAASIKKVVSEFSEDSPATSQVQEKEAVERKASHEDVERSRKAQKISGRAEIRTLGPREYRAAWKAIAMRDVTIQERIELQLAVLRKWALIDMEGAMAAMLEGAWDGGRNEGGATALTQAFHEAFQHQPLEAWHMMKSGRLGLGATFFMNEWVNAAAQKEPAFVISKLAEIPVGARPNAIYSAMAMAGQSPEIRADLIKSLGELPDVDGANGWIAMAFNAMPGGGDPTALRDKLNAASDPREKTIALHAYAASLRDADTATLQSEWSQLPNDIRGRAAVALFNAEPGTKNAPEVLDMIIASEQWQYMQDAVGKLRDYADRTSNPVALAEWGMKLPERGDTVELFNRAVEPYFTHHNQAAKSWLTSLPADDWRRDRALAQFSANALWKGDPQDSLWAVDLISDSKVKQQALKKRGEWESQTRQKLK